VKLKKVLHSVIDKVFNWNNLKSASRKVVQNKGSGGIDGMSVEKWVEKEDRHLSHLRKQLIEDTYRSKPVKRSYIDKPGSKKKRPLGVPVVKDRACQQATHNVLSPVFEEYFHEDSYGFRPGRSTHMAARRVEEIGREGYRYVVDLDIKGFFDHVDHEILMGLVRQVVKDRRVLGLIRGWLVAGVMEEGNVRYQTTGTPQGGVISPLLSNIYLTPFDNALTEEGYRFVRYADDVVILCRDKEEADRALGFARQSLARLKLELSEEKTTIATFKSGFDFLGFRFKLGGRGISSKSIKAFYQKVREATRRHQRDRPVEEIIEAVNPILRGWGNYHKEGRNVGIFTVLDNWVRRRLRAYIYKRWITRKWFEVSKPTKEDFERKGLFSLRGILRPKHLQLQLF
jgi:group II intron reverse transcriptase/maturase